MAAETNSPEISQGVNLEYLSISFNAQCRHEAAEGETEGQLKQVNETISLNFRDEDALDQLVNEKPYVLDILPIVLKRMRASYDPGKSGLKKLNQAINKAK